MSSDISANYGILPLFPNIGHCQYQYLILGVNPPHFIKKVKTQLYYINKNLFCQYKLYMSDFFTKSTDASISL